MIIDILFIIIFILACIKGFRQGLIVAFFSLVAFIIGLAAAMKLSVVVSGYIGKSTEIAVQWLPVISFAVVFLIVVLLIRWGASLIQKSIEFGMLGWANRAAGVLLYACLYILIYSIALFYAEQVNLIDDEIKKESVTYFYIQPLGPKVMDTIGRLIPVFKNMFEELKDFFGGLAGNIPVAE
jgi:membrane protein required for colicin V production